MRLALSVAYVWYPGLVKIIPVSLKIAAACGIGLFLALIGLSHTTGIGAVSGAVTTSLQVAGCPDEYFENGMCKSHKMTSHTVSWPITSTYTKASADQLQKDVARCHARRYIHSIPHGIQGQKRDDCWHSSRVYHLMAVSA